MTYSHDPDDTRVIPPVAGQPGNGWAAEERAARAAGQKAHLRNWLATGDKTLDPDSAKGRELAPSIHGGLAIASFVLVFFCGPAALICGIMSLAQARRERRRASGLAQAGVIISVIEGVITALVITIIIATTLFAASQVANLNTTGG